MKSEDFYQCCHPEINTVSKIIAKPVYFLGIHMHAHEIELSYCIM